MGPCTVPTSSSTWILDASRAAGAVVSTLTVKAPEGGLSLPAGSTAVVVSRCEPSASGVVGVKLQVPSGCTVVLPMGLALS
ncbi:MAG: hypothetical protein ABS94_27325 [Variovorax sp. SCN 67-85]|nr:MAG: hypothetical protein ABS94_27325 [Variovorax sp. SCN 67-85]